MSMSDCIKCWSTPCACGYEYRLWSKKQRIKIAAVILGVTEDTLVNNKEIPNQHPMFKGEN